MAKNFSIYIMTGNGVLVGITDEEELLFTDKDERFLFYTGIKSKQQIKFLIEYLDRLSIHLPER